MISDKYVVFPTFSAILGSGTNAVADAELAAKRQPEDKVMRDTCIETKLMAAIREKRTWGQSTFPFVDFGAESSTPHVWKVVKAHLRVRRDLSTVLFAMRIIGHV
jgi:hypothetical protein